MNAEQDHLRQIAESLASLERLYTEEARRNDQMRKESNERMKQSEERQKKWDKIGLFQNPWLQPTQIAHLLLMVALLVLSITVLILVRR